MKRLLLLATMALCVPAATAGTNTFGLFVGSHGCGSCGCPGPWNAFSPTNCCSVANAAGCSLYPGGHSGDPYLAGGQRIGGGCGPAGCGSHQWHGFTKHWGHARGFAYDLPLTPPCGSIMAFTGTPGGLGCGDPYNGCGSAPKHPFLAKFAHHGATTAPPECLFDYFKGGWGHKLAGGHTFGVSGHAAGGCANGQCGGSLAQSDEAVPMPAPASVSAPMFQPVSYQQGYYPQGYYYYGYYPGYGYYPAYGYPTGR
ncbi:MAG: hypothetical protein ACRC33_19025 [Gemmataceae bacterium]